MKVEDFLVGIEPGVYILKPAWIDETAQTRNGDPMISVQWEVVKGPYAGATVWDNLPKTQAAAFKWAQLYIAFGGSPQDEVESFEDLTKRVIDAANTGSTVYAKVVRETYQGRARARIGEYLPQDIGVKLIEAQNRAEPPSDVPF